MKSIFHSQTSTVQSFKFGSGWIISSHILLDLCFLIHAGIKIIHTGWSGPRLFITSSSKPLSQWQCDKIGYMYRSDDLYVVISIFRTKQNGWHFAEEFFKWSFSWITNVAYWFISHRIPYYEPTCTHIRFTQQQYLNKRAHFRTN